MDRTLILVKPDAFARGLSGEIIARFERKGLSIVALRHMTVERELAERHYAEHAERPFFGELVDFITSGPIVAMVLEGTDAVRAARQLIGATDPLEAAPARSAAISRSRWAPTWFTARIRRSPPRARRRCSSRTCGSRSRDSPTRPRLGLASAAGDSRASAGCVHGQGVERAGARAGRPRRGDGRERPAQGVRRAPAGSARGGARMRHGRGARRPDLRQATRRGRGP